MRNSLRAALVAAAVVLTAPLWGWARLALAIGLGDGPFASCSQLLGLFPGVGGVYLRRGFLLMTLDKFALNCSVGFGSWFSHPQVSLGRGVCIGANCTIGMCEIGEHTLVGSNVDILSGRHQHGFADPNVPLEQQGGAFTKLRIGANVWIGNSAVVMADIGDRSVIGAGSVVVKPIPARCVAAGNPAVVKKTRSEPTPPHEQDAEIGCGGRPPGDSRPASLPDNAGTP
ncbi:MAG: acyltransferase [Anaerolineae bacterium]